MEAVKVLEVVIREMRAYGWGWRNDWSQFDGRLLRDQLCALSAWARKAIAGEITEEYLDGTKFEARDA